MFENQTILITGGTGSFGRNFAKYVLKKYSVEKLIVFSRDEFKQSEMASVMKDSRLRFFLGDVRDLSRLKMAMRDVDIVIHAAALKQIPTLEYNPFEAVKTNILGTQNIIEAAIENEVKKVLLISTDKAAQPINLYGSTKLCAEKLISSANFYSPNKTRFSAVRYGNVMGSRGSIVEHILKNINSKTISLTDPRMTRFWISFEESFKLVEYALENMNGGEIFIPKLPSMKIIDMFDALIPKARHKKIGIRPGEKLHEILITPEEARNSYNLEKYYIILPPYEPYENAYDFWRRNGIKLHEDFKYSSDTNDLWLTKKNFLSKINKIKLI